MVDGAKFQLKKIDSKHLLLYDLHWKMSASLTRQFVNRSTPQKKDEVPV